VRNFLFFVLLCVFGVFWVDDYVSSGRMIALLDAHPHRRGTASALFYMGRYYELFGHEERSLQCYSRIVERYPKSRYGMDAHMGQAVALEHLKRYREALECYHAFLEKFPASPNATTVKNSIDYLRQ
jgi:tetratricopeptide (TPR) repeat protein